VGGGRDGGDGGGDQSAPAPGEVHTEGPLRGGHAGAISIAAQNISDLKTYVIDVNKAHTPEEGAHSPS
jgi:hypothetical protein